MTDEIGPFDPGTFYKEEQIREIISAYLYNTDAYINYDDFKLHIQQITLLIIKYLDENYMGAKDGMDQR